MNYYSFHIGDYRRDTAHLSLLEHGVYRQLLDWIYLDEKPIPKETDMVFRRLCARTDEEKGAVIIVLGELFKLTESGYIQARCMGEIATYQGQAARARENGKLGGRPPKTTVVISGLLEKTQTKANQEPRTNNQEPLPTNQEVNPPPPSVLGLDSVAWTKWMEYRKEIGKPIKKASLLSAQKMLARYGVTQSDVVEQSIANGYQGLFELKTGNVKPTQQAFDPCRGAI